MTTNPNPPPDITPPVMTLRALAESLGWAVSFEITDSRATFVLMPVASIRQARSVQEAIDILGVVAAHRQRLQVDEGHGDE